MVGLAALGAGDDATLHVLAERAAHHADVLLQDELVLRGAQNHLVVVVRVRLVEGAARAGAGRVLRPLQGDQGGYTEVTERSQRSLRLQGAGEQGSRWAGAIDLTIDAEINGDWWCRCYGDTQLEMVCSVFRQCWGVYETFNA